MSEKKRILVVDDEDSIRNVLSSMLCRLGYGDVVSAKSGEEALDILEESSFDLIISDMIMSGMNGIDLLKKVKQSDSNVLFIICTGSGKVDLYFEAMNYGAFECLNKPVEINELKKVIDTALS